VRNHITLSSTKQVDKHNDKDVQVQPKQGHQQARSIVQATKAVHQQSTKQVDKHNDKEVQVQHKQVHQQARKRILPHINKQVHCQEGNCKQSRAVQGQPSLTHLLPKKVVTYEERDG
jgi:hypothetical protein